MDDHHTHDLFMYSNSMDLRRNPVVRDVPSFGRDVKPMVPLVFDRRGYLPAPGFLSSLISSVRFIIISFTDAIRLVCVVKTQQSIIN